MGMHSSSVVYHTLRENIYWTTYNPGHNELPCNEMMSEPYHGVGSLALAE